MKYFKPVNLIGLLAIFTGIFWLYQSNPVSGILYLVNSEKPSFPVDYLLVGSIHLLLAIPAIMGIYFGWKLLSHVCKSNIKGTVGALGLMAIIPSAGLFSKYSPSLNDIYPTLFFLIATIIIVPVYILISQYLMERESITPPEFKEFISRNILILIALLVYFVLQEFVIQFRDKPDINILLRESLWGAVSELLVLLSPIIIAIFFYKISIRLLKIEERTRMFS